MKNNKLFSLLLILVMVIAFVVPVATPAAADSTYSLSNPASVYPFQKGVSPAQTRLGTIVINVSESSVTSAAFGSYVYLELPADFQFRDNTGAPFVDGALPGTYVAFPGPATDYAFDTYGASGVGDVQVFSENGGNRLKVIINTAGDPANGILSLKPGMIILQNLRLFTPGSAANGLVTVNTIAPSTSVFTGGQSINLARVCVETVLVANATTDSLGPEGGYVTLKVTEYSYGAMAKTDTALKFTLPSGFKWDNPTNPTHPASAEVYWNGGSIQDGAALITNLSRANDDRDLILVNNSVPTPFAGIYFKLNAYVNVDTTVAKPGDVEISLGGDSSYTPSTLTLTKYADFDITISTTSVPDIMAGKYGQKVGEIVIEESVEGSLIPNRTVSLTLPYGAKWAAVPSLNWAGTTTGGVTGNNFAGISNDCRTIKYIVTMPVGQTTTSDKARLVFKDGEVITAADFSGDLKVTASGSLGLTDEIVIAKVNPVINASVADKKELKIGVASQVISDLVIEETAKEVITVRTNAMTVNNNGLVVDNGGRIDGFVDIIAPPGVTFEVMPTVNVDGDVKIDSSIQGANLTSDNRVVRIPVTSTSTNPSKLTLTNIKLNVDRTVVEGDLKLWVGGTALVDDVVTAVLTNNYLFEPQRYAAAVAVGTVITPAPGETRATAEFIIGSTTYRVSGVEKTMDVAPYIKSGRTYLPVRYVANVLGVDDANIFWDEANGKVTMQKENKFVQLIIGSKTMIVNGVNIAMDVAPEIVDGRTTLPLRFISMVMGAGIKWDEATNTVSINQ